jgi:hypothetical protein
MTTLSAPPATGHERPAEGRRAPTEDIWQRRRFFEALPGALRRRGSSPASAVWAIGRG